MGSDIIVTKDANTSIDNDAISSQWKDCTICHKNKISIKRNKRGWCKSCREKETYSRKKKKTDTITIDFSFESGCRLAIADPESIVHHEKQATSAAQMLGCQPLELTLWKENNVSTTTYALLKNSESTRLAKFLDFETSTVSKEYLCSFRFPRLELPITEKDHGAFSNLPSLMTSVRSSAYPKLLDAFGPFEELTNEIALLLNYDFRNNPQLLSAVSKLFAGTIIHSGSTTLFIISCEVYSRHTGIDTHAETNGESLPVGQTIYPSISCSIIRDSDGRKMKQKLIIGTNTINLLSTCSTTICHSPSISIGPQTLLPELAVTSAQARIYLQSGRVRAFVDSMKNNTCNIGSNVSALRQLITGFDHYSTYEPLRSSHKEFDTCLHMPATIFTYCDTPNNDGFGANTVSSSKLASKILQLFAISVLTNDGHLHKNGLTQTIRSYDTIAETKNGKQWDILTAVIKVIKKELELKDRVDVFYICTIHNMSDLARVAGDKLSTANSKIADNVKKRLQQLLS